VGAPSNCTIVESKAMKAQAAREWRVSQDQEGIRRINQSASLL
jgi:hypothetical protein